MSKTIFVFNITSSFIQTKMCTKIETLFEWQYKLLHCSTFGAILIRQINQCPRFCPQTDKNTML